ncbi:MAG: hypothetical protein JNN31_02465, partial [Dechloromonas sp.]|nr:hypothetical protein [Dechloromonas sp.]
QLAAAPVPEEKWIGGLTDDQFQVLLSRNKAGDFLRYVAECCVTEATAQADIDDYIAALKTAPKTHGSALQKRRLFGGKDTGPYILVE